MNMIIKTKCSKNHVYLHVDNFQSISEKQRQRRYMALKTQIIQKKNSAWKTRVSDEHTALLGTSEWWLTVHSQFRDVCTRCWHWHHWAHIQTGSLSLASPWVIKGIKSLHILLLRNPTQAWRSLTEPHAVISESSDVCEDEATVCLRTHFPSRALRAEPSWGQQSRQR